jgi:glycolate oxidase FAD binding subunit
VVRADGVRAHSGGKVVKNVAGYDVGKLLTGSYGTLAVLTEVAFRLHPLPPSRTWVSVPVASVAEAHAVTRWVVHSQLAPTAVELDRPADGGWTLSLLLEGIPAGVEGRTGRALDLLGTAATASGDPPPWWGREPFGSTGVALKLTFEIAGLPHLLTALQESAAACGLQVDGRGSVGVGTLLAGVRGAPEPEAVARLVSGLRQRAASYGGSVVVLDAPPHVKAAVDVWGPVPGLDLMRAVKSRFDPQRRLAPGRFVGGI